MDKTEYIRKPEVIHASLKELPNKSIIALTNCKIQFPVRYEEVSLAVVEKLKGKIPIFGVCLGHQTIAQAFGSKITRAKEPVHGKVHSIRHNGTGVFTNVKNPLKVTRYHSLIVDKATLTNELEITAETEDGEIMGIRHKSYLIEGVQFHPEAILSECGRQILCNFLDRIRKVD